MRKLLVSLLAVFALAPAARAAEKFGVIDFQRAMSECDEGKAIIGQLQAEMKDKQAQLDAKQKEFRAAADDFEKQSSLLNEQTKQQKGAELEKRSQDLQKMYMQLQQELAQKEQEATKGIGQKMRTVVKEIVDASGIQLVVDAGSVIYISPGLEITNEAIRKYNAKFPYKGGAAGAAAGTGATKPAGTKSK